MIPSLRPHSSAMKLLVTPIFLAKPTFHSPFSFLIRPPQPAGPELPDEAPSELSLAHPFSGFSQWILLTTLLPLRFWVFAQCSNSKASLSALWPTFSWMFVFRKTTPLLCFHIYQTANKKTMVLTNGPTSQSNQFNWEPALNPVRLWLKPKNSLKTGEIWTVQLENWEPTRLNRLLTGWVFFSFSQPKTTLFWLKTNCKDS